MVWILRVKGVRLDWIVVIISDYSIELVVGILVVLKVGGVYVFIDLDYLE